MTQDVLLTLLVAAGAVLLFVWNRLRLDVVGLIVMATLILTGLVTPTEAISGFSNEALLTVAAMFVLSAGLVRTGAIDLLGSLIGRLAGGSELRLVGIVVALVVPLSAFVNNTPIVVVMTPMVLGIARRIAVAPSKVLMPLSFSSQLGGTLTLIGTSTNLLVAGLAVQLGLPRLGLFEVTGAAACLAVVGVLYLLGPGRWLTPVRSTSKDLLQSYELRDYLTVLLLEPGSDLAGRTLAESSFSTRFGLELVAIERDGRRIESPAADTVLRVGDVLLAEGKVGEIAKLEESAHLRVRRPDDDFPEPQPAGGSEDEHAPRLAELLVSPRSRAIGRSIRQLNFRQRYGVPVLGIQRHGVTLRERLRDVLLAPGDLLLVKGSPAALRRLHAGRDLALLGAVDHPVRRRRKLKYALPILAAVVGLAAFDALPILVSALLGVIAMFLTRCVTPEEAYEDMDLMVIVLLASILPLGIAMQKTGAAALLAESLLALTAPLGLLGALAAFYLLTSLLTEIVSNNAAAVVLTPIAVATGQGLCVSPMPFVVAVMLAASNSFMTPIGYQTNTFIHGPGGYRFTDFLRVGGPLNVLLFLVALLVIPHFFPF